MSGDRAAGWLNLALFGFAAFVALAFTAIGAVALLREPGFASDAEDPVVEEQAANGEQERNVAILRGPAAPLVFGAGVGLAGGVSLGGLRWHRRHRRELEAGR